MVLLLGRRELHKQTENEKKMKMELKPLTALHSSNKRSSSSSSAAAAAGAATGAGATGGCGAAAGVGAAGGVGVAAGGGGATTDAIGAKVKSLRGFPCCAIRISWLRTAQTSSISRVALQSSNNSDCSSAFRSLRGFPCFAISWPPAQAEGGARAAARAGAGAAGGCGAAGGGGAAAGGCGAAGGGGATAGVEAPAGGSGATTDAIDAKLKSAFASDTARSARATQTNRKGQEIENGIKTFSAFARQFRSLESTGSFFVLRFSAVDESYTNKQKMRRN